MSFKAFADSTASYAVDNLTFENNDERVSIYGSINIGRDQQGFMQAKELQTIINGLVAYLEQQHDLPQRIETFSAKEVQNPFLNSDDA